jgi:hypothetical protein
MNEFERIISDSMQAFADYNDFDYDDHDMILDDEWVDVDDYYPEDFQGEEEFA